MGDGGCACELPGRVTATAMPAATAATTATAAAMRERRTQNCA